MSLDNYEKAIDKTFDTVNTVYSAGRRIGYFIMGVVFLIAGIAMAVWGYVNVKNKIDGTAFVKTEAVVISMREVPPTQDAGITWAPVLKFKDKKGIEHTFESTVSSDPPAYDIGEKVEVLYPEGKPGDVFINSFTEKWLTPILLGVAGLIMFIVSIWMVFTAFRRTKSVSDSRSGNSDSSSYVSIG